jgi:hypothetical protein
MYKVTSARMNVYIWKVTCHNVARLGSCLDLEDFFAKGGKKESSLSALGIKRPKNHVGTFDPFNHLYNTCGFTKDDFQKGYMVMFNVRFLDVD